MDIFGQGSWPGFQHANPQNFFGSPMFPVKEIALLSGYSSGMCPTLETFASANEPWISA